MILTSGKEQRAFANISASTTDGSVISAVEGKKLRIHSFILMAGATATSATFNSKGSGAGSAISAAFQCGVNGGVAPAESSIGWFETNSGEGLTLTTGSGSTVGVQVLYSVV